MMIVCPDAYAAIDVYQALKANRILTDTPQDNYIIKGWKMFSKHMKPEQ